MRQHVQQAASGVGRLAGQVPQGVPSAARSRSAIEGAGRSLARVGLLLEEFGRDATGFADRLAGGGGAGRFSGLGTGPADPYARPSRFRKGVRDTTWEAAIEPATGRVRDALSGRFVPHRQWDMGHKPGHEFSKHASSARARQITRAEFLDEHNTPAHYRPELPSSNRSHRGELVTDEYFGE